MLPLLHTLSFIMCYAFFFVRNQQNTREFSRPQNSVQAVEIHTAGSGDLLSSFHCWESGGCFPSACLSHTLMPCPDHLLSAPALSVPKPFLGPRIFPDKVSVLDKAFVAHRESFFSNVALGFPPFVRLALDFSWWQLFHKKKRRKCSDGIWEQSLYQECVFF